MRYLVFLLCAAVLTAAPNCEELRFELFPENIVEDVLERYEVDPRNWVDIIQELRRKSVLIENRVKAKAARMDPNPYDEPKQLLVITKLRREEEIDLFQETLEEYGVKDIPEIYEMFDLIQNMKAQAYWDCYYYSK